MMLSLSTKQEEYLIKVLRILNNSGICTIRVSDGWVDTEYIVDIIKDGIYGIHQAEWLNDIQNIRIINDRIVRNGK